MLVVTCNWIPPLSSFSSLQQHSSQAAAHNIHAISQHNGATPALLHHYCLRNREWNKGSKRPRLWSFIKQQQTSICPLSTSTFCVATIYHFALSTSDLPQYKIITIYSLSTIYIQCTVNIQYIQFPPQVPWTKWSIEYPRLKLVMSLLENYSRPRPGWGRAGGGRGGGRSRPWRNRTCCQRGTFPPRPAPPPYDQLSSLSYYH